MSVTKKSTTVFLLLLLSLSTLPAGAGQIDLHFQGKTLSAQVEDAPLKELLDRLKRERGIWVKGTETLTTDDTVSVQFTDLPIEAGFQRMLSGLNYSLAFDRKGGIVGITLLGESVPESRRPGTGVRYRRPTRGPSFRR